MYFHNLHLFDCIVGRFHFVQDILFLTGFSSCKNFFFSGKTGKTWGSRELLINELMIIITNTYIIMLIITRISKVERIKLMRIRRISTFFIFHGNSKIWPRSSFQAGKLQPSVLSFCCLRDLRLKHKLDFLESAHNPDIDDYLFLKIAGTGEKIEICQFFKRYWGSVWAHVFITLPPTTGAYTGVMI